LSRRPVYNADRAGHTKRHSMVKRRREFRNPDCLSEPLHNLFSRTERDTRLLYTAQPGQSDHAPREKAFVKLSLVAGHVQRSYSIASAGCVPFLD